MNYAECARAAFGEDGLVSPPEFRRMMREILMSPQQYSNDADAIAWTLRNPWSHAQVVEKRTVVKEYFGALYKTAQEHTK
jgi:hypothetical protein